MPHRKPAPVVVIDDHPEHLDVVTTMLQRRGYATVGFANASAALGYIEQQPVSLIITDIYMPDMDGIELVRCVGQTFPGLPVIAISGSDRSDDQFLLNAMRTFGAQAVFAKPLQEADLLAMVAILVGPP
jgi:CheY-like chemotaxis protein